GKSEHWRLAQRALGAEQNFVVGTIGIDLNEVRVRRSFPFQKLVQLDSIGGGRAGRIRTAWAIGLPDSASSRGAGSPERLIVMRLDFLAAQSFREKHVILPVPDVGRIVADP